VILPHRHAPVRVLVAIMGFGSSFELDDFEFALGSGRRESL
jgi:hypothetical protein